jgi:hypothetical protein
MFEEKKIVFMEVVASRYKTPSQSTWMWPIPRAKTWGAMLTARSRMGYRFDTDGA